ncbi:release factor glutamine methyltransferase [Dokdonia pacifica]|uniref:Release factor glutamine methyltransferase n=1 Tax=Dokdonia pacifica TaxID=1627892 RepID=A0A238ZHC0_9FLAO|nr:peptide chain release factor N(5)-glutamine methyltransferase [Dokdonia pacifica]GGG06369.1 release factor glutamine methyltransferase [Dokdonia pacifica]SNR82572.1 release factor glutamine methyltransferase [Dokdonia pacifica]
MKIKDLRTAFVDRLQDHYPLEEVQSFFQITAHHFLGYSRMDIVLQLEEVVEEVKVQQFLTTCDRLKNHEPIQYILGDTEFYGLPFKVTPATLIPRPETEELVSWILEDLPKDTTLQLLDIGTGSGCIAISLAKHMEQTNVTAYDISEDAIKVASENAILNKVTVTFTSVDILKTTRLDQSYDCIVSNPPYVRELEKEEIQSNVLDHEPHSALFVSDTDPLVFYRAIGKLSYDNLSGNGRLFFEINQYLGKETVQLLKEIGFTQVELRQDIFGNDRMIKASR